MKIFLYLWLVIRDAYRWFFWSDCPKCGSKCSVYFSHTEHFTPGEPDVHICENCKEWIY
jgi:hypothetical protein